MSLLRVAEVMELLSSARVTGERAAAYLDELDAEGVANVEVIPVQEAGGATDFIRVLVPGLAGKSIGGDHPTLTVVGRLGGPVHAPNSSASFQMPMELLWLWRLQLGC